MNKLESDILNRLLHEPFTNKRALAEVSGDSLEIVNHELENLMNEGYIDKSIHLTDKALSEFEQKNHNVLLSWLQGLVCEWCPSIPKCLKGL